MISARFEPAIRRIKNLAKYDEYVGAFIFGSVARGDADDDSDLDVKVVTKNDNPCPNINHPIINGVKLDVTFGSQDQLAQMTARQMESSRPCMLAESVIVFDKTGHVAQLKKSCTKKNPSRYIKKDNQGVQFVVFHANDKAERHLKKDPYSSLLSMNMGLGDLLRIHYKLSGKWWVSDKRLLGDLEMWDSDLAKLVRVFLTVDAAKAKFNVWSKIIDHILKPLGGRKQIKKMNCRCKNCKKTSPHFKIKKSLNRVCAFYCQ